MDGYSFSFEDTIIGCVCGFSVLSPWGFSSEQCYHFHIPTEIFISFPWMLTHTCFHFLLVQELKTT